MSVPELDQLLKMSEDNLYQELAEALVGGPGFGPLDPERNRKFGRDWFQNNLREIRAKVCGNSAVRQFRSEQTQNAFMHASAIADAVSTIGGRPAATIIAVIVMRMGVEEFCGEC